MTIKSAKKPKFDLTKWTAIVSSGVATIFIASVISSLNSFVKTTQMDIHKLSLIQSENIVDIQENKNRSKTNREKIYTLQNDLKKEMGDIRVAIGRIESRLFN